MQRNNVFFKTQQIDFIVYHQICPTKYAMHSHNCKNNWSEGKFRTDNDDILCAVLIFVSSHRRWQGVNSWNSVTIPVTWLLIYMTKNKCENSEACGVIIWNNNKLFTNTTTDTANKTDSSQTQILDFAQYCCIHDCDSCCIPGARGSLVFEMERKEKELKM